MTEAEFHAEILARRHEASREAAERGFLLLFPDDLYYTPRGWSREELEAQVKLRRN
jgi:hypothetical protein